MDQEWLLLHLTDIHFGQEKYLDDTKVPVEPDYRYKFVQKFQKGLAGCRELVKERKGFDAILVTGDITTKGNEYGFDEFKKKAIPCLKKLVPQRPRAICIVPGNHDVERDLKRTDSNFFDKKFSPFRKMVGVIGVTSCLFPKGTVHPDDWEEELCFFKEDNSPIFLDRERKILVLCINSAIRCGEIEEETRGECIKQLVIIKEKLKPFSSGLVRKNVGTQQEEALEKLENLIAGLTFRDVAHVTPSQIEYMKNALEKIAKNHQKEWNYFLKIAILHHHLVPFENQDTEHKPFDLTCDSSKVLEMLAEKNFNLVLTGHKHQTYEQPYMYGAQTMVIAGGATIQGTPSGITQSGFRLIRVTTSTGKLFGRFQNIQIRQGEKNIKDEINQVQNPKETKYLGVYPASSWEGTSSNESCFVPKIPIGQRNSSYKEWLIFWKVVGCEMARRKLLKTLPSVLSRHKLKTLQFLGLYDLYGEYDLLIRVSDKKLQYSFIVELNNELRDSGKFDKELVYGPPKPPITGQKSGSKKQRFISTPEDYIRSKSQKAFILLVNTRSGSKFDDEELVDLHKSLVQILEKISPKIDEGNWEIFLSDQGIVLEILLRCGQYYLLQGITRELEKIFDKNGKDKLTHLAYFHQEQHPYTFLEKSLSGEILV